MARRRSDRPYAAAYRGRRARDHKARWLKARDQLATVRVRPAARVAMGVLVQRMQVRPHLRDVLVGYGGVKDLRHKRYLEARQAAGLPPPIKGLAEESGMCRSSMIRAVRALAAAGIVEKIRGVGRGNANAYRLGPAYAPPASDDQVVAAEPQAAVDWQRQRELLRGAVERGLGRGGGDP